MSAEKLSSEAVEKFHKQLKSDESGATLRKALRNIFSELADTETETGKKYDNYAQELEAYGAPKQIVGVFKRMAADEMQHHFVFMKLLYGLK